MVDTAVNVARGVPDKGRVCFRDVFVGVTGAQPCGFRDNNAEDYVDLELLVQRDGGEIADHSSNFLIDSHLHTGRPEDMHNKRNTMRSVRVTTSASQDARLKTRLRDFASLGASASRDVHDKQDKREQSAYNSNM
jgi:hypothetical protein